MPDDDQSTSATDTEPDAPLGAGESTATGAEEQAPDRDDVGQKGPSNRPVGKTDEDDSNDGPIDPASPDLQSG